jgi:hypothetical protein
MSDSEEWKNVHYLDYVANRIFSPLKLRRNITERYDNLGRNITEQEKRQNMVPWITVRKRKFRKPTNKL